MTLSPFARRLWLDTSLAACFFIALAYYWQSNLLHELIGLVFFVGLFCHLIMNRRWLTRQPKTLAKHTRGWVQLSLHALFAIALLGLLITSPLLSRSLLDPGAFNNGEGWARTPLIAGLSARQLHPFFAYWALALMGLHIGMHLFKVLAFTKVDKLKGRIPAHWAWRLAIKSLLVIGGLVVSVYTAQALGLIDKLTLTPALFMWDFEQQALGYFVLLSGLVLAFATLSHLGLSLRKVSSRRHRG